MNNTKIEIETASVKVMRSFDYCHFEVSLSSSSANTPELVDELRKSAARLADKAVKQYQIAKAESGKLLMRKDEMRWAYERVRRLEEKPEGDRTPEEQAAIKAHHDERFAQKQESRSYDYEDDYPEDDDQ